MPPELAIRPWAADDVPVLRDLLTAYLHEAPGDLRATERSVDYLLALGLGGAVLAQPCLVLEADGAVVGFVLWLGTPIPCDTRGVPCQGFGTYLRPAYRRRGLGALLWDAALRRAAEIGYTRVVLATYAETTRRGLEAAGFQQTGWVMEAACHPPS